MAITTKHQPDRSSELLAYMNLIMRASTKYKWPSWVIYDQNFRLEAAMGEQVDWAKSDPSLFAQCFTGQALSVESWCKICHSLYHGTIQCPYALTQPKRPKSSTSWQLFHKDTTCRNFQIDGRCKYRKSCRFDHLCQTCHGKHQWCWKTKCPLKEMRSHKTMLHDCMWSVIQARNFSQYSSKKLQSVFISTIVPSCQLWCFVCGMDLCMIQTGQYTIIYQNFKVAIMG